MRTSSRPSYFATITAGARPEGRDVFRDALLSAGCSARYAASAIPSIAERDAIPGKARRRK